MSKEKIARVILDKLLQKAVNDPLDASEYWTGFKAIFIAHDPELVYQFANAIQDEMDKVYLGLTQTTEEKQTQKLQILLGNLLCYFSYLEPNAQTLIEVPQSLALPDGAKKSWQKVTYRCEPLQISPAFPSPIYAYGFVPLNHTPAPALLLYTGTTIPTARGAMNALFYDIWPFHMVGEGLYHYGRATIQAWINQHGQPDKRVQVYGQSLGGALSLLTAAHQPELVCAHAYNTPLFGSRMKRLLQQSRTKQSTPPQIHCYQPRHDFINLFGHYCPAGAKYYEIALENTRESCHASFFTPFRHHAVSLVNNKRASVTERDVNAINHSWGRFIIGLLSVVIQIPLFLFALSLTVLCSLLHGFHAQRCGQNLTRKPPLAAP